LLLEKRVMKKIQVIDGARNATFSIFQATEDEFLKIFPSDGQDIEIAVDFHSRVGGKAALRILSPIWERPIYKGDAIGIHWTSYYNDVSHRNLPPSKRECDRNPLSINQYERLLYARMKSARSPAESQ